MDMQVGMHHGMGQMGMAGPDASAANIAVLQAGYDAFAHGDLDRLLTYFADDIQWDAVGPAGVLPIFGKFHGKDQVKQWFMTVGATMEPEPFRDVHFMGEGDTVIAWGMSRATFRATGKVVDTPFIHVAKFQDGKIVWYQCFEDTAADVMAAK
jgi:ketosteroid isomerase-like protein